MLKICNGKLTLGFYVFSFLTLQSVFYSEPSHLLYLSSVKMLIISVGHCAMCRRGWVKTIISVWDYKSERKTHFYKWGCHLALGESFP